MLNGCRFVTVNDELGRICKEAVVASSEIPPDTLRD
jgi:hypothetical protein